MKKKLFHAAAPLFGFLVFIFALRMLHHSLAHYHYHDVVRSLQHIPPYRIFLALVLACSGYLVMTGYDALALRYVRHSLPYRRIAVASFIGYAVSNTVGLSWLTGSSIRFSLYSEWGLSAVEITHVVAFCGLTVWLGFLMLSGIIFLVAPPDIPDTLHIPFYGVESLGALFIMAVLAYLLLCASLKKPLRILQWEFRLPALHLSAAQIMLSALDWICASGVVYVLLPAANPHLPYPHFLGIFFLAQIAGSASQVPGGLGVFETVAILLLSPYLHSSDVLGSLMAFRVIYCLFPLGIASVLLGSHEVLHRKEQFKETAHFFSSLVPYALSAAVFVMGVILIFSGTAPVEKAQMKWLKTFYPLTVIEISHFLGSLVGVGLLLLARGLQRRLDGAYVLTGGLLGAGIVLSLLKGFNYVNAAALLILLLILLSCHRHFYRKAILLNEPFSPGWIFAILLIMACSVWLGAFSYKHVEYSSNLWWKFSFTGDAPRFLRATVGVIGAALFFSVAHLLRPSPPELSPTFGKDAEAVSSVVKNAENAMSELAYLDDKSFLFSKSKKSFIMYGVHGRSWIALGDPAGEKSENRELAWMFRELCNLHDGWTVFYGVDAENIPLYLDLGLTLLKVGEEAAVPLETFSLEGSARRGLRYTHNKLEKAGCVFELIPREQVPPLLPELKVISDNWLETKNTREKKFTLGCFDENYLKHFDMATVRHGGKIVAFANVLRGADKKELSADLMRYSSDAPHDVMEYLFIKIMLKGKEEGYAYFNFGMAPLSGFENRELAPLWLKLGSFVYHHIDHFYNFQGLREYKEKFDPVWKPKYLASPGGLFLPQILMDITGITSGGVKGLILK